MLRVVFCESDEVIRIDEMMKGAKIVGANMVARFEKRVRKMSFNGRDQNQHKEVGRRNISENRMGFVPKPIEYRDSS